MLHVDPLFLSGRREEESARPREQRPSVRPPRSTVFAQNPVQPGTPINLPNPLVPLPPPFSRMITLFSPAVIMSGAHVQCFQVRSEADRAPAAPRPDVLPARAPRDHRRRGAGALAV